MIPGADAAGVTERRIILSIETNSFVNNAKNNITNDTNIVNNHNNSKNNNILDCNNSRNH